MPEDIIAYVCSDLSAHAPQAEAGLRDQACDRILGRYIQQEDLDRMRDDPDDLLACLQECITLDNEQLAKAKDELSKFAPPAESLDLGGSANTRPKREWAEVKKLGTNRETALALFGLDLRDRVSEVARRFGLAMRASVGAAASNTPTDPGALLAAVSKAASTKTSGGAMAAAANPTEKKQMTAGRCVDSNLLSLMGRDQDFPGKTEIENFMTEWNAKEVHGLAESEVRAWYYDRVDDGGAPIKGFRTKFQESHSTCRRISLMTVQKFSPADAAPQIEFLRNMDSVHNELMASLIHQHRGRGALDGDNIFRTNIKGLNVDIVGEVGATGQPVKAEVRGEDTDVTVHAKDDFPSQFPMIVVNTALLRSRPGLYTTAGVPDDVLSHIETSLRLLNMEDGVAFDRKACDTLLDTYRTLLFGHVGQEDAIAATSLRILTDHWPSIVRAIYISATQFRLQTNGESAHYGLASGMVSITLDMLLSKSKLSATTPNFVTQLEARLRRIERTLQDGEPHGSQEAWPETEVCPAKIRPAPSAQGLACNSPQVFPSPEKATKLQPWVDNAMETDVGSAIVDNLKRTATDGDDNPPARRRKRKERRKALAGGGERATTPAPGATAADSMPPPPVSEQPAMTPVEKGTSAESAIDVSKVETRRAATPGGTESHCTADLKADPVRVVTSRDVSWKVNDLMRECAKAMIPRIAKETGTLICPNDMVLQNQHVRGGLKAAGVTEQAMRCAYGTECKFLHRHEATKGGAAYNDLLPGDYDKRQWNAMPTVRNSPSMPFVSRNCAGEFTGL